MIVTLELIAYLAAVIKAVVTEGRTEIPLTTTCPECGDAVDQFGESERGGPHHLVIETTSDTYAVVVGCEGYFVVNPNLVGIDSPMWSDGDVCL
jgi:hypothetical protein